MWQMPKNSLRFSKFRHSIPWGVTEAKAYGTHFPAGCGFLSLGIRQASTALQIGEKVVHYVIILDLFRREQCI